MDVCRGQRQGQPPRAPTHRAGRRAGAVRGAGAAALGRSGRGDLGRAQGGRGLRPDRPGLPGRPHRLHGRGRSPRPHPSSGRPRRHRPARHQPRRCHRPEQPRVRHLHVGFDGSSQGRGDSAPERGAAAALHRGMVRFRPGRRVDAVPLLRVRLLRLGAVGSAPLRRPSRRRPVPDVPHARRLPQASGSREGHRPQPDPVGLLPADGRRQGQPRHRPRPALHRVRR